MIEKWLAIWGLNLQEYLGILGNNGASDGLEVWAASLAMNQPLNVIMADSVWCMAYDGLDFLYPTIMLTSFECSMFCALDKQEQRKLMQAAGPPTPSVKVVAGPRKGRPLTSILEYLPQVDLDRSDTDPESLLTEEATVNVPAPGTGEAIPCTCPVCKADLTSGMALFQHLRSKHPEEKPYTCNDCQHCFNNLKELSSHHSNIHRRCKVSCNQCTYRTTTKAKMCQHICIHTRGVPCPQCGRSFPTLTEML